MSGINLGRVIAGGLLAGLVINIGETILNVVTLSSSPSSLASRRSGSMRRSDLASIAGAWLYTE